MARRMLWRVRPRSILSKGVRGGQLPPLLRPEEIYMADVEAFERLQVELELPPTQHGNATAMCLEKSRTKLAMFVFNKK